MKTLTVCSYYGTGSSAVTDFFCEFDNVNSYSYMELRFAHDPDGLSELEYNLVQNFNRHNSGHALKRYKKFVDYYSSHFLTKRYESIFKGRWKELSYNYIEKLTDFSFPGMWDFDGYDNGPWWEFWHKLPNRILKVLKGGTVDCEAGLWSKEITYASHPSEEKFLRVTKEYTDSLFECLNNERKDFLMLDQIVPSSNIEHHMRYFNNLKVFVVDRDPRDLYLICKYVYNSRIAPKDPDLFCQWYEYARSTRKEENWDPAKICFIQFEDLIYKYDESAEKLMAFAGLKNEHHINPKTCFNPAVSIKNTRLWIQHPEYKEEADYIAQKLPEYLYHLDGE